MGPVLLSRGFVLIGDMTFAPVQPWNGAWLGLDGSVPRAVPADAIVSVLSHVVPGDLLQKAILLGALVGAATGMVRLVRGLVGATARIAPLGAGVLFVWNPWVLERLAIGHWGLLIGYAALPWLASAAFAHRDSGRHLGPVVVALAVAAFGSPTGGAAAGLVALVICTDRVQVRRSLLVLGAVVAVNLPWLLPGFLGSTAPTDPHGVAAFAARSDTAYGVVGSLLTFGGIWKAAVVPGDRGSALLVGVALLISVAGLVALACRARTDRRLRPLCWLAAVGFILAALPTISVGADVATWMVDHLPGAGLLRDSQKWLLLFVLATCVGVGLALDRLARLLRAHVLPARSATLACALLPIVVLPSLAWGIAGELRPAHYPREWTQVRTILEHQPARDRRTVVLPFSAYHRYDWNRQRAVLDPAIRFFPGEVVTNDALTVSASLTVAGEDRVAARIATALARHDAITPVLRAAGIRYVLVEKALPRGDPSRAAYAELLGTTASLHDGPQLQLLDLGSGSKAPHASWAPVIVAGDLVALGVLCIGIFWTLRRITGKKDDIG
jgi:hypothetical protein